ncbi:MAG: patatin-like phospholipase family protein [Acidobacteria bacterium]|nr:MAG: patatin-like phospholipase family protein [Acidobacteriota bacterium]
MKVNLVLSGGAARGIAHIGVIRALEELGFEIASISGVSAGALVGAFYCAGYKPDDMLKIVVSKSWLRYIRPKVPKLGFFSLNRATAFLHKHLHVERIEELRRELWITALDINSGRTLHFNSGELYPILLGSCALPGVFEPVKYGEFTLIDGGVTNNLPVEPLLGRKGLLIGVDVNPTLQGESLRNIFQILMRSFLLAVRSNVDKRKELCHVVIEPELHRFSTVDLWKAKDIYGLGYKKTLQVMKAYVQ